MVGYGAKMPLIDVVGSGFESFAGKQAWSMLYLNGDVGQGWGTTEPQVVDSDGGFHQDDLKVWPVEERGGASLFLAVDANGTGKFEVRIDPRTSKTVYDPSKDDPLWEFPIGPFRPDTSTTVDVAPDSGLLALDKHPLLRGHIDVVAVAADQEQ